MAAVGETVATDPGPGDGDGDGMDGDDDDGGGFVPTLGFIGLVTGLLLALAVMSVIRRRD